ncbi:MAG: MBL fold metallo-hydrolase [Candidatus Acidiferrum sp.]
MQIKILGSAASGGFPQWNCACANCVGVREGTFHGEVRTQTQIAFSPLPGIWFLVGMSPDLRTQLTTAPELAPGPDKLERSPIAGVFLLSAEVESVMGLLHLREFQNFFVFATPAVQRLIKNENRIFKVLDRATPPVQWQMLSSRGRIGCHLSENPGDPATFYYTSVPLGATYPDFASEDFQRNAPPEEASVGLVLEQDGKKIFIAPSLSGNSSWSKTAATSDLVLIDGTFWSDDELSQTGRSDKSARALGHLPLSGPGGLLEQYPRDAKGRVVLININNTNPILDGESAEHRAAVDAGFEIAYDGMQFEL